MLKITATRAAARRRYTQSTARPLPFSFQAASLIANAAMARPRGDANSTPTTTRQDSVVVDVEGGGREKQATPTPPPLLRHKVGSVGSGTTMSSLRVVNVSPKLESSLKDPPLSPLDDILASPLSTPPRLAHEPFTSYYEEHMSPIASPAPPSVFDIPEEQHDETHTEPTTALDSGRDSEDQDSYNLKPPLPPTAYQKQSGLEELATRFFSIEHLNVILQDYALTLRFTRFLDQYRPQHISALKQYAEARKAIAAVEYANAIAKQLQTLPGQRPLAAATLDERFEASSKQTVQDLVEEALPAYLTHRLVSLVTDNLVKEITGNSAPIMTELIPSLAEVYCISDPSMPDNPIVYASEGKIYFSRSCNITDIGLRVLQHHAIFQRVYHRSQLSLPPRTQIITLICQETDRDPQPRRRMLRDDTQLPTRWFAVHESPLDRPLVRQQGHGAIFPRSSD